MMSAALARLTAALIDHGSMPPEFAAQGLKEEDLAPGRCQG